MTLGDFEEVVGVNDLYVAAHHLKVEKSTDMMFRPPHPRPKPYLVLNGRSRSNNPIALFCERATIDVNSKNNSAPVCDCNLCGIGPGNIHLGVEKMYV